MEIVWTERQITPIIHEGRFTSLPVDDSAFSLAKGRARSFVFGGPCQLKRVHCSILRGFVADPVYLYRFRLLINGVVLGPQDTSWLVLAHQEWLDAPLDLYQGSEVGEGDILEVQVKGWREDGGSYGHDRFKPIQVRLLYDEIVRPLQGWDEDPFSLSGV